MKICLVASNGGHLLQLTILDAWWSKHERFWVTFDTLDAKSQLRNERVYWAYHPTNRNVKNFLRNLGLAAKILRRERPDLIVSTGAGVAVPFFYLGKLLRIPLVYIEVYDRIDSPTITGRLVYPIVDRFVVQWEEQKAFYPKAVNLGAMM